MALRPTLRRMYVTVEDVRSYWPAVRELRFRPIAAPAVLDGREYTTVVLDFGPDSVDGWLVDVLATELGLADEPSLDTGARTLTVHGEPIALTPLEFGLFQHLRDREGRTVTRPELLREVWGTGTRAATSSTRSCTPCGRSSARRPRWSRPCGAGVTGFARTGVCT